MPRGPLLSHEARRAAGIIFAILYGSLGFFLALCAPTQGVPMLWTLLSWPLYFSQFSQAGALLLLAVYAGLACYGGKLIAGELRIGQRSAGAHHSKISAELDSTRVQLDRCRASGRQAIRERDAALSRLAEAAEQLPARSGAPGSDPRFKSARQAFARLYHPDNVKADGIEKVLRTEIFKEFWSELERIEHDARART